MALARPGDLGKIQTRPEDLGESNTGPSKGLGQTQTRPGDLGESKHLARLIDLGTQSFSRPEDLGKSAKVKGITLN